MEQRMVKAGERVGNLWVIDSGVKAGEKIIVEGLQKVSPGVKVSAKTEKREEGASPSESPPPAESKPRERGKIGHGKFFHPPAHRCYSDFDHAWS